MAYCSPLWSGIGFYLSVNFLLFYCRMCRLAHHKPSTSTCSMKTYTMPLGTLLSISVAPQMWVSLWGSIWLLLEIFTATLSSRLSWCSTDTAVIPRGFWGGASLCWKLRFPPQVLRGSKVHELLAVSLGLFGHPLIAPSLGSWVRDGQNPICSP